MRTPSYDKSGLKKGNWTAEEDRKLVAYVTRYGCWNWRQLPRFAGLKRCGKSCRLRWLNYLRPNIKRGNYTPDEEDMIIELHEKLGNRWSAIAAQLSGRTDNDIKNLWHTSLKKRLQHNSSLTNKKAQVISRSKHHNPHESWQFGTDSMSNNDHSQGIPAGSFSPRSFSETASSSNVNFLLEDDFGFLDSYTTGNFWTEPYTASGEIMANNIDESLTQTTNQIPDVSALCPQPWLSESLSLDQTFENFWTQPYLTDNDIYMSHILSGDFKCKF